MGFGSFSSSPANSPIIKGKLFSRLTSNPPPSPVSTNSSAASSPTSLASPSCSLTSLPSHGQGASKLKAPTVLKLAAASQKLSLTKPVSEQQKESVSSTRQHQENDSSPQRSSATSSGRSSRSPTSRLPPSAAMDTIFEEDGLQGSKTSIGNNFDSSDTSHLSRSSTFAPRSSARSENGSTALTEEGDNGKRIVDNDTKFEESVANFSQLHSSIEEEGASTSPLQSPVRVPQRSRRGATLSIDAAEELAATAEKIQTTSSFQSDRNSLRRQNSSNSLSFRASLPLSYSRSKTLPVSQSIHNLRSREAGGEMTKSGNKPLSRTASVPGLDCITEREANSEEIKWLKDREPVAKLRRSNENLSGADEDKGTGLSKRPKAQNKFPIHIQKMLTEHLQKKMASLRPQSPLVMHQLKSPHRSQSLRVSSSQSAHVEPPRDAKDVTPKRALAYSRSTSESVREDKTSSLQPRDNSCKSSISSRKTAIIPERDNSSASRLVVRGSIRRKKNCDYICVLMLIACTNVALSK